ncbi:hypothetical protein, partial [Desulfamplus magnetovallimortis]|uniref:hypothetical protein n=1 Tax=Desulfamplus magnetovallimortis TaxID=1246637 RepID=UPI001C954100
MSKVWKNEGVERQDHMIGMDVSVEGVERQEMTHDWDGCKCRRCGRCGEIRDEQHDWDGCKCRRCGEIRDEQHDW